MSNHADDVRWLTTPVSREDEDEAPESTPDNPYGLPPMRKGE